MTLTLYKLAYIHSDLPPSGVHCPCLINSKPSFFSQAHTDPLSKLLQWLLVHNDIIQRGEKTGHYSSVQAFAKGRKSCESKQMA